MNIYVTRSSELPVSIVLDEMNEGGRMKDALNYFVSRLGIRSLFEEVIIQFDNAVAEGKALRLDRVGNLTHISSFLPTNSSQGLSTTSYDTCDATSGLSLYSLSNPEMSDYLSVPSFQHCYPSRQGTFARIHPLARHIRKSPTSYILFNS